LRTVSLWKCIVKFLLICFVTVMDHGLCRPTGLRVYFFFFVLLLCFYLCVVYCPPISVNYRLLIINFTALRWLGLHGTTNYAAFKRCAARWANRWTSVLSWRVRGGGLEAPVTGLVYRHIMAVTPAGRQVRVSDTTVASKTRHCVRAPCPTLITPVHWQTRAFAAETQQRISLYGHEPSRQNSFRRLKYPCDILPCSSRSVQWACMRAINNTVFTRSSS